MSETNVLREIVKLCSEYDVQLARNNGRGKLHVNEVRQIIKSISMTAKGGIAMSEKDWQEE